MIYLLTCKASYLSFDKSAKWKYVTLLGPIESSSVSDLLLSSESEREADHLRFLCCFFLLCLLISSSSFSSDDNITIGL